jgi:hypothetical protein
MRAQQGTIARADEIVTFTAPRQAHVFISLTKGPTYVAQIGSPAEAIVSSLHLNLIHPRDYAALIAPRPAESNKEITGTCWSLAGQWERPVRSPWREWQLCALARDCRPWQLRSPHSRRLLDFIQNL